MRFEHILQIYWTKGFFYGGKLFYVNQTFGELFKQTPGLGSRVKCKFVDRFELTFFINSGKHDILENYQNKKKTPLSNTY
jgi:hypothetical protein